MHDLTFADSARQAPARILRLPMLPYSIGHEILLLSQRNALLFDRGAFDCLDQSQQRLALIRAALTCYRTWNQNQKPERNLWLWGWFIRNCDVAVEIAEFRNYRTAGCQCPPAPTQEAFQIAAGKDEEERGRELGGSHLARLVGYFTGRNVALGYETPFDVPMGLANFIYLSELEAQGDCRIENARELQVREEMAQHRADIAKERANRCQP